MPSGYLYGWDAVGESWVKVECDADGYLKIDPALLFENPPTEDEAEKGPSSEWAFDHDADANAHHTPPVAGDFDHADLANVLPDQHHAKYTDVESRAAIDDLLDANGDLLRDLTCNYKQILRIKAFNFRYAPTDAVYKAMGAVTNQPIIRFTASESGVGYHDTRLQAYKTDHYAYIVDDDTFVDNFADLLENPPTEDESGKAPTSEWAFDHDADVDAHHAKYTDLEAQTACNLNGNLYWSCPGVSFQAEDPATDELSNETDGSAKAITNGIDIYTGVDLPDGATITEVKVMGNAGAEGEYWYIYRILLTDLTRVTVSYALVNTASSTIISGVVDNSLYGYFIKVAGLETNDIVNGCFIKYTL